MKELARRIVYGKPSEESRLIAKASEFPRYTPTEITYRDFKIKVTDMLSVAWQIHEFFVDERMKFKAKNNSPLIVDCGANVGVSLLYYASAQPNAKVICFEPDPAVFKCLQTNVEANKLKDVQCHQQAVWTHSNGVQFGSEGADGGSVLRTTNAQELPSVRLKDVLEQHLVIDLLKMDIEGAETTVLLDCAEALKRVQYLYVEYHSFPESEQRLHELLHLLNEQGFRYYVDRVGVRHKHPFAGLEPAGMDMQLDIHAIRE